LVADVPRVKLSELVGQYGPGLSSDARRCKALLGDVCRNQYRAECAVLVAAVEEGVAGDLLSTSSGLPVEVLLGRLSDRLQADRGISPDLARWSVECWAVALGVAADGSILTKFKMQGLAPLIDLASADGRISEAQLNHLIAEAKARGVSEADARVYLSVYAAARGWQLGEPQRASGRARPRAPQMAPSPPPRPQPAPARGFRWIVPGLVGLIAIAVIVLVIRLNQGNERHLADTQLHQPQFLTAGRGRLLAELEGPSSDELHTSWPVIDSVSWSPDGSRLVIAYEDSGARVWDARTGALLSILQGRCKNLSRAAWSPDGRRIVAPSDRNAVRIWDASTGATLGDLRGHTDEVTTASWSPDGLRIVSGSADKTARI
jgi:hypothetical protein